MSVFYEDRRYWAMREDSYPKLGSTVTLLIACTDPGSHVAPYDPVFAFSRNQLVTQYEVVDPQPAVHAPLLQDVRAGFVPVQAKVTGTQADTLKLVSPSDNPAFDFLLRFARRQVLTKVLEALDKHQGQSGIAYSLPVKVGDQLLDAFQLPFTDYHWEGVD